MDYQNNNYNDCTLWAMCGLPRSGKSTKARQLAQENGWMLIESDAARLALHGQPFIQQSEDLIWASIKWMVRTGFLSGNKNIIIDCVNHTKYRRQAWISKNWKTEWIFVDTPVEVCIERAKATNQEYLISVIERMHKEADWIM